MAEWKCRSCGKIVERWLGPVPCTSCGAMNLSPVVPDRITELERELAEARAALAQERESHHQNLGQCNEHVGELRETLCQILERIERVIRDFAVCPIAPKSDPWKVICEIGDRLKQALGQVGLGGGR